MDDREASLRAIAVCGCGGQTFILRIYADGSYRAVCWLCCAPWEAPWKSEAQDAGGVKAVDNGGDVASDVVFAPTGRPSSGDGQGQGG